MESILFDESMARSSTRRASETGPRTTTRPISEGGPRATTKPASEGGPSPENSALTEETEAKESRRSIYKFSTITTATTIGSRLTVVGLSNRQRAKNEGLIKAYSVLTLACLTLSLVSVFLAAFVHPKAKPVLAEKLRWPLFAIAQLALLLGIYSVFVNN